MRALETREAELRTIEVGGHRRSSFLGACAGCLPPLQALLSGVPLGACPEPCFCLA